MKALVWKEWRENRLIVVWAAVLTLVLAIGLLAYESNNRRVALYIFDRSGFLGDIVPIVWALSALLCGSAIVSPEVGSGSLQFLSVLPISRGRIWWTKIAVGLCLVVGCMAAAAVTLRFVASVAVATKTIVAVRGTELASLIRFDPGSFAGVLALFAVGAAVSTLVDRTISALMTSAVIAVIVWASFFATNDIIQKFWPSYDNIVLCVLFALDVGVLLGASYTIFTRGETLRTAKRLRLLAGFGLPALVIVGAIAIAHAVFIG